MRAEAGCFPEMSRLLIADSEKMIRHRGVDRVYFFKFGSKERLRDPKLIPENFVNDLRGNENVGLLPFQRIEQLFPLNGSVKLQVLICVNT